MKRGLQSSLGRKALGSQLLHLILAAGVEVSYDDARIQLFALIRCFGCLLFESILTEEEE